MNNQLLLGGVVAGSAVVVTGAVIGVNKVLRAKKAVEDANMEVSIQVTNSLISILDTLTREAPFTEYEKSFRVLEMHVKIKDYFNRSFTSNDVKGVKESSELVKELLELVKLTVDKADVVKEEQKIVFVSKELNKLNKAYDKFFKKCEKVIK